MSTGQTTLHRPRGAGGPRRALMALGALLLTAILIALLVDRIFFHDTSSPAGTGSGDAATQTRALPPFTGLDLAGDNNVVVEVGGTAVRRRPRRPQPAPTGHDARPLGPARDRDDAREPHRQEPDVRHGERALPRRRQASGGREHRRDRDPQPGPDRRAAGERQHRRDRDHDEAPRHDQRRREPRCCAGSSRATRRRRSMATAPSCSPRPTASRRGSRAAAPSRMAATLRTSPRGSPAAAPSALDSRGRPSVPAAPTAWGWCRAGAARRRHPAPALRRSRPWPARRPTPPAARRACRRS